MIHPMLRLAVTQPQLLADHAEAYVDLIGEEVGRTAKAYGMRAAGGAIALVMALVFLLLAGVAIMLWAVTPSADLHAPWALFVVPAIPALIAVAGGIVAMKKTEAPFIELKQQFAADLSMIRQVSAA